MEEDACFHTFCFYGGVVKENVYQARIIRRLKKEFPESIVIKNDSSYIQGIPDVLILHGPRWAMIEVKVDAYSDVQPNQEYYVTKLNEMSYATFVFPENEEQVFHELQLALCFRR